MRLFSQMVYFFNDRDFTQYLEEFAQVRQVSKTKGHLIMQRGIQSFPPLRGWSNKAMNLVALFKQKFR